MGSFVPRLLALTVVWLLATAALTYAAAQRMGTPVATTPRQVSTAATPQILVVPDVRRQAFVFSKGTLNDAGFAFRVTGPVQGFAANTVVSQTPAPGTRVIDTGAPLVVLHLARSGRQVGLPEDVSAMTPTAVKLVDAPAHALKPAKRAARPATTARAHPRKPATATVKATPKPNAPRHAPKRVVAKRPPAFVVPGARREPLDEIPLTARAKALLVWLHGHPSATDANVKHWLYQHNWIVAGAEMGWWHGAEALHTLITADQRVWALWGIGARSSAVARRALAEVQARSR